MTTTGPATTNEKKALFPIIGIGASAGGLVPFEVILEALPTDLPAAIIFISHLPADKKSLLPVILRDRFPSRGITEITNALAIEKGKVYVNQPDYDVAIESGRFRSKRKTKSGLHFPIDTFFASLAEEVRDNAVAVILSGMGTDGSRGAREVQCKCGTVLVQDPESAEFPGMPESAIETGMVDEVLAPEGIARHVVTLVETIANQHGAENPEDRTSLDSLLNLLHEKAGFRFEDYKKTVFARRVQRRMSLQGLVSIDAYKELLDKTPAEIGRLAADMMIGVTAFFRDPASWEALKRDVIHRLIDDKKSTDSLRVWTPGCSTGEEAYSIAMMLLTEIERAGKHCDIQVFATDINEAALAIARNGRYPGSVSADIPAGYLKAYFTCMDDGSHIQINKYVRDHVVFAKHCVLSDPPFSRLDLLICRNLLIYLESEAQEKCLSVFHYALKEDGHLFLGNAESIGRKKTLFKSVGDKSRRIYKCLTPAKPVCYSFPTAVGPKSPANAGPDAGAAMIDKTITEFARETLLSLYAPASVLINNRYEILYFNGPVKRFLEPPSGQSSFDFLTWIPEQMRNRVRGALFNAAQTPEPVSVAVSLPDAENRERLVTLTIRLYKDPVNQSDLCLIVFSDQTSAHQAESAAIQNADADRAAIRQLDRELTTMRDKLQINIEELKSANEELQSSNEELQATNEEMETSREELQSLNEELVTVNAQLQTKIEEQEETNNDLNNFLSSTNIPTLFLDQACNVRRFTPAMTRLIKLIPSDIGRPLSDMSLDCLGAGIIDDARAVLENLVPVRKEIPICNVWYVRSTLPYRTSDNRIEGVVITYVDITERVLAEAKLKEQEEKFRAIFENNNDAILIVDLATGRYIDCNQMMRTMSGFTQDDICSMKAGGLLSLPHKAEAESNMRDIRTSGVLRGETEIITKDGTFRPIEYSASLLTIHNRQCLVSMIRDITERKRLEEEIRTLARFPSENPNPILRIAGNGMLLYANEASGPLLKMWNCDSGGLVPEYLHRLIADTLANRLPKSLDMECDQRAYSFVVVPIVAAGYVNLYGRDVTERKKTEEALFESRKHNEFLVDIIESSSQPFGVGYPDGRMGLTNKAFEDLTGYSRDELQVIDWAKALTPPEWIELEWKKLEELHKTGIPVRYEKEYIKKDGTRVPIELLVHCVKNQDGNPLYYYSFITDITERKKAEEALRESEERYRNLVRYAPAGIYEIDFTTGRYTEVNDVMCRMLGYTRDELFAISAFDILDEESKARFQSRIHQAQSGELPEESVEYRARAKDGRLIWGLLNVTFHWSGGKIVGAMVVAYDITERKKAEEALRESEERYRNLFNTMEEGFCIIEMLFDAEGMPADYRFLEVNAAFERQTGLHEAQGKLMRDLTPAHEAHWFETYGKIALTGESARFTNEARALDRWYDVYAYRVGKPEDRQVAILFNDISDRKRLEENQRIILQRFYLILSSMHFGILLVTDENKVEFANQAFCDLFGLQDLPNDLLNMSASDMIEKIRYSYADPDAAVAHIQEIVNMGQPVRGEDIGMSGERTFLRDYIPIRLNEKKYGRLWIHVDITGRKRTETELRHHAAELTAANKSLEAFAYSISHDLRNPLHSILACSEVIKDSLPPDADGHKALDHIVKATNRMGQVISDLMSLSKIAGQEVHFTKCNLSDMARSIVEELKVLEPERKVAINIEPEIIADVDEGLIWILLQNLIHNAWKFSSKKEDACIEFGKIEEDKSPAYFVRDNGAGFDMATAERLFNPFQRLHSREEYSGTGIGLTIVKRIIEKHGGAVWVEAEKDKGATFFFRFGT